MKSPAVPCGLPSVKVATVPVNGSPSTGWIGLRVAVKGASATTTGVATTTRATVGPAAVGSQAVLPSGLTAIRTTAPPGSVVSRGLPSGPRSASANRLPNSPFRAAVRAPPESRRSKLRPVPNVIPWLASLSIAVFERTSVPASDPETLRR